MDLNDQSTPITLSVEAAHAVQTLMAQKNLSGYSLRMFISGGGCSGFQYGMALDNRERETDLKTTQHGVQVLVDEVSIQYLRGATVDFINEPGGSGFKITNPNPMPSCGCDSADEADCASGGCSGCGD